MKQKGLMTLFRDFLVILSKAERFSSYNILNQFLVLEKLDVSFNRRDQIHKEIANHMSELEHYRENLIHNSGVSRELDLDKLTRYRKRAIQGIKTIKNHIMTANPDKKADMINIKNDLKSAYNLLLKTVRDELQSTQVNKQTGF